MNPALDLDLLRTFVFIAETGSLSQAAACVHRTQSAISMQVRRLEDLIGKRLIERSGRGVRLTAVGAHTVRHARKLLRLHDEAMADLTGEGLAGLVRFGVADDYAEAFLPPLLGVFAARYPGVGIEVACAPTPELRRNLKAGGLDLAILTVASNAQDKVLRREPLVWIGARDGAAESIEPLPLALSHRDAVDRRAVLKALKKVGRSYRIAYESGSAAGLIAVVRSDLAIAVLARCSVPKDLRILNGADRLPSLPSVDLVLRTSRTISLPARRLAEHVSSTLSTLAS
jgi:DNA-binding transcriptional LysR family regulator